MLLASLALACAGAFACPPPQDVTAAGMLGTWQAEFEDRGPGATLVLEAHPEYGNSFRGALSRAGERRHLAGDVDAGDVTLEESADGLRIAAVWVGEVVDGSCGREVRGAWQAEGSPVQRQFVLRRQ